MKTLFVWLLLFYNALVVLDAAAPTKAPMSTPTRAPTRMPTKSPTSNPSTIPTRAPTFQPTASPSVDGEQQLFAVVGGASCAENLYYGPQYITQSGSEDGKYPYFLSTNTLSNAVEHTNWLQIVTSDGSNELFRIYWSFRTAKTLAQRFNSATLGNEVVDYRIVTNTGDTYYKFGTWRFSNSAQLYTTKFSVSSTTCCFSADDGAWGAGSGTIDANGSGYSAAQFWGIGNWDAGDSYCTYVYRNGVRDTTITGTKVYMYYFAPVPPSAEPTAAPTAPSKTPTATPTKVPTREPTTKPTSTNPTLRPTLAPSTPPTKLPTSLPTPSPSVTGDQQLFAVVGGNVNSAKCASSLIFGPQAITEAGSADGVYPYFFSTGTASKNVPHTNWVQVVTSDSGSGSEELFRIYWSFRTAKTLADRFVYATSYGEMVDYRIEVAATNETIYKSGNWKYSSYAGISNKFQLQYTACCLSSSYGVWGAGLNTLDGYGYNNANNQFWGVGNFYSSDTYACNKVYKNGVIDTSINNVKVYMYYFAPTPPTTAPTTVPTKLPTLQPTAKPTTAPSVVATLPGVDVKYEQFATLSGSQCAQSLPYGPTGVSIKGQVGTSATAYLSTNTANRDVLHTEWMQIVTSDGTNELFRVYWTFATPRTLKDHFVYAVNSGESVSYRVVKADGTNYFYSGLWRFSNAAGNMDAKFGYAYSSSSFSDNYGIWGGGNGALNGNSYSSQIYATQFWGVGNIGSTDYNSCIYVYQLGYATYLPYQKTYMYYSTERKPTSLPTPAPTRFDYTLFAVVGGDSCTENLYYGPAAITTSGGDGHEYFFSTGTAGKNILHSEWLQVVKDGDVELFRIYWTFAVPRTLENHFLFAVYYGESVAYRVVVNSTEYTYSGTWRFSDAAGLTTAKFATTTTQSGFSVDDGAWGAGSNTINANGNEIGYTYISYWGIGNWNALDNTCSVVYMNGVAFTQYSNAKTYMYYAAITTPTALPTTPPGAPSAVPTRAPTSARPTTTPTTRTPSLAPTPRVAPPTGANDVLFAVFGGGVCAESLPYGPSAITTSGTTDNMYQNYLSTNTAAKDQVHTEWLQIVTSDGSYELFRIYWTFATPRTLKDHFVYAVNSGESVSYRVVERDGTEYTYTGLWRFSDGAGSMGAKFDTTYTQSSFSADDGVWGAGSGTINPNSNPSGYAYINFWGVGNWDTGDYNCNYVYMNGGSWTYALNRVYMYYTGVPVPTKTPTTEPSRPSAVPSKVPTVLPTRVPSTKPTTRPTAKPTIAPTNTPPPVSNTYEMFAVLGGSSCAENLYYGPQTVSASGSADGYYSTYMSTVTGSTPHNSWLQIVTSDGANEVFRIYWTFSSTKSVAQRLTDAVSSGEYVSYRVQTNNGNVYTYSGLWQFSDSANFYAAKFSNSYTTCCLSADDGVWGAGTGTINANGNPNAYSSNNFWGVGNWDAGDSDCSRIYQNGLVYSGASNMKVYMYYDTSTAHATLAPVANPTRMPVAPSRKPTTSPTTFIAPELFAVVGGSSCAETLYYGPQSITTSGSADGQHPYFLSTSTNTRNTAHLYWMQVVTSDGTNELFRIYWTFAVPRTLANRFSFAVPYGDAVTYTVVTKGGAQYTFEATWRFSYRAQINVNKFSTSFTTTPFSADSGVWGGGTGYVDSNYVPSDFWGIGNFGSYDGYECSKVYQNGVANTYYNAKVYMYTSAVPFVVEPTQMPTTAPPVVSLQAQQQVDGVSAAAFTANEEAFVAVFSATIADAAGVSVDSVKDLVCLVTLSSKSVRESIGGSGVGSGVGGKGSVDGEVGGGYHKASAGDRSGSVLDVERHLDTPTTTTTTTTTTFSTTTTATNLRTNGKTTLSDYIVIRYRIEVPVSSGVTYSQLSSQLASNVQNDVFTNLLQQHAAEQNVPELSSATSDRVDTEDTTPNSEKSSKSTIFTVPVMVGIGIGGCAVFVVVIYLFTRLCFRRAPGPDGLPQLDTLQNQASAPPQASDPTLSKDINAYFYGDSGLNNPSNGGNQIVPHEHDNHHDPESAFDRSGGGGEGSSRDTNVSTHMSAHRPHAADGGIEMQMYSPNHTSHTGDTNTSPVPKSASAPLSPVAHALPIAALAVPVSHMVNYNDIAIAEVYIGEAEEYKE